MPNGPILVVDDEPLNLDAMRQILGGDYRLVFARDGLEALSAAVRHQPALVLLDIQMPGMDGYAACRALKQDARTAQVPVIFVTALSDSWDEARGFECGAVDYIVKPVSPHVVRARVRTHLSLVRASQLEQSHRDAIYMLSTAGHYNDTDTGMHIWRIGAFARQLAQAAGWSTADSKELELAAPMHDTGKLGIPSTILRKPGRLDAAEWDVMKTHARIGYEILSTSKASVFRLAAQIALRHHEWWDGSGYPDGLRAEEIPESARIVAIADVFDALTMKRPYKDPWPTERVVEALRQGSGTHFEPRLVSLFLEHLPDMLALQAEWRVRESVDSHQGGKAVARPLAAPG